MQTNARGRPGFFIALTEAAMLSKREIGLMLLASLATVALGLGYGFTRPAEQPCVWHDVLVMPADPDQAARAIDALALDLTRETNKNRRSGVVLTCRLTTQSSVRTVGAAGAESR